MAEPVVRTPALPSWRDAFRIQRPVPPTPASRRLRALIGVTALAVVVVETLNLISVDEPGFALAVRTGWALLRVIGFLFLMRAVRFGRMVARPFGLVLAVTTVFAVVRLVEPRTGSPVPASAVIVGLVVLTVLCAAVVWGLYRSPAVHEHLSSRPVRRHVPGWILTVRVAALAYGALLIVPFLVAVGTVFAEPALPLPATLALLGWWLVLAVVVTFTAGWGSFFVVLGRRWARRAITTLSVLLLVVQPVLCLVLLGVEGLLRDGVPMVVTTLLCLLALHRSRGLSTWTRSGPTGGTAPTPATAGPRSS